MIFNVTNDAINRNMFKYLQNMQHPFHVIIKDGSPKRSLGQNNLYATWAREIGLHIGYSENNMRVELSTLYLEPDAYTNMQGKVFIIPRSTATLSTKEMTDFMDDVYRFACENDIQLPTEEYSGIKW